MLLNELFLIELDWRDRSPVAHALQQHKGRRRFVHFSPINKIGVNASTKPGVKSAHQDPAGVYFYPVDWVLTTDKDGVISGHQYGFDRPYWFVADVNWSAPGGIILSQMTWDDLRAIARRNGWLDAFESFMARPPEERPLPHYRKADVPGSMFWHFCDAMNKVRHYAEVMDMSKNTIPSMTWQQSLRGVSFVYDDNTSTIHSNEPHQLLVIDPRVYRIVDSGVNRLALGPHRNTWSGNPPFKDRGEWEFWAPAIKEIMARVAREYGGSIRWVKKDSSHKHREPEAVFSVGDRSFALTFTYRNSPDFWLSYRYGRAEGWRDIKEIEHLNIDDIMERVHAKVDEVMALESDLLFKPVIDEDEAKKIVAEKLIAAPLDTWTTKIDNDSSRKKIDINGERRWNEFGLSLRTLGDVTIYEDHVSFGAYFFVNDKSAFLTAHTYSFDGAVDPRSQDLTEAFESLTSSFDKTFDLRVQSLGPGEQKFHYRFQPKIPADMLDAFKGWMIVASGFKFGDVLASRYKDEVAAYHAYEDKDALHDTIAYVLKEYLR